MTFEKQIDNFLIQRKQFDNFYKQAEMFLHQQNIANQFSNSTQLIPSMQNMVDAAFPLNNYESLAESGAIKQAIYLQNFNYSFNAITSFTLSTLENSISALPIDSHFCKTLLWQQTIITNLSMFNFDSLLFLEMQMNQYEQLITDLYNCFDILDIEPVNHNLIMENISKLFNKFFTKKNMKNFIKFLISVANITSVVITLGVHITPSQSSKLLEEQFSKIIVTEEKLLKAIEENTKHIQDQTDNCQCDV